MDAWSGLFLVASSVSLQSVLSLWTRQPEGRVIREREKLRLAIGGCLAAVDSELVRLEDAARNTGTEGKRHILEVIGSLVAAEEILLAQGKKLRGISQEEWNTTRDETLETLERTRCFLLKNNPGLAPGHG